MFLKELRNYRIFSSSWEYHICCGMVVFCATWYVSIVIIDKIWNWCSPVWLERPSPLSGEIEVGKYAQPVNLLLIWQEKLNKEKKEDAVEALGIFLLYVNGKCWRNRAWISAVELPLRKGRFYLTKSSVYGLLLRIMEV